MLTLSFSSFAVASPRISCGFAENAAVDPRTDRSALQSPMIEQDAFNFGRTTLLVDGRPFLRSPILGGSGMHTAGRTGFILRSFGK